MPPSHWSFAFSTVVYLINYLPTPTLNLMSPYHNLFGVPPNYSKLRSFGCLCYPWLRPYSPNKIIPCSSPCVFIGYSSTQSAYLCLDLSESRIHTSPHVKFVDSVFPFTGHQPDLVRQSNVTPSQWISILLPIKNTPSLRSDPTPPVVPLPNTPSMSQTSPSVMTPIP